MPAEMRRPVPRPGVLEIAPYVGGRAKVDGVEKSFKLSANETPLGASSMAMEAFKSAAPYLHDYPEGSAFRMREAIGARYGIDAERIVCGAGSDELLHLLAQAYLGPGDEAIVSEHGFLVYPIVTRAAGAALVTVPEPDLVAEVDRILGAVTERTKVVFLANPNNPTGTYLPSAELRRLQAGLPPHVLLVVDAAYAEYVTANDYEAGIELVATSDNVVMTRTFSKIYGLAALRLGWLYAPAHVVDAIHRIRGPFNVSIPAIEAGVAALADQAHVDTARAHNEKWLRWLTDEIAALGLEVVPSAGNFLMIGFPQTPGQTAADADAFLVKEGLILRQLGNYGLPNHLRLSVGVDEANELVVAALKRFVETTGIRQAADV